MPTDPLLAVATSDARSGSAPRRAARHMAGGLFAETGPGEHSPGDSCPTAGCPWSNHGGSRFRLSSRLSRRRCLCRGLQDGCVIGFTDDGPRDKLAKRWLGREGVSACTSLSTA